MYLIIEQCISSEIALHFFQTDNQIVIGFLNDRPLLHLGL